MGGSHTCLHAGFVTASSGIYAAFLCVRSGGSKTKNEAGGTYLWWRLCMFVCTHVGSRLAQEMGLGKVSFPLKFEKRAHETRLQTVFLFEVPATLLTHQVSLTFPACSTSGSLWFSNVILDSNALSFHFTHICFLHFII